MQRNDQIELLRHGAIEVEGRVAGSSNQALLVSVTLDGVTARACYKAEAGERPLWDFDDGLWRREVAAWELDQLLGTNLVPVTIARDDLPFGVGSLQWWIDDATDDHYFTLREKQALLPWFTDLCAFDVVANNADRKGGHILFDSSRCWAIDNGLCFNEEEKLRTVIWEYAEQVLPDRLLEPLARLAEGESGDLGFYLSAEEVAATVGRAHQLLIASSFPSPNEESDWPPYPWPLI
ncbi:MAG: phosphatidylinositol kinase [Acidimicrobiaceae bacterium]|nr:phosphatidylinositol kinase [Acidimicrobiaceae bacterium]